MDTLNTTYRLVVIGDSGMYATGKTAATPELARLVPGSLLRQRYGEMRLLGIERTEWTMGPTPSGGRAAPEPQPSRTVLIDAETTPGQWEIGVKGD